MSLRSPEEIFPRLICPRCRTPVRRSGDLFHCSGSECPYRSLTGFPVVGSHPALIDFERSIVRREELVRTRGSSPLPRGGRAGASGWLRALADPRNHVAERHAVRLREELCLRTPSPTLLVVGGGTVGNGASALYEFPELRIVAFDVYASPWTQFIADAHAIPLPDGSVDAVWVQAVLEHVLDPWQAVREIERVLVPDGLVYAETPFLQQVHEGPYDFTRYTESGHRWLFRRFERLDSGVVAGGGNQLVWTLEYLTRSLLRSPAAGKVARVATSWLNAVDRLLPERYSIDGASCLFFYGRKSERELTPAEIVSHYRGAQRLQS